MLQVVFVALPGRSSWTWDTCPNRTSTPQCQGRPDAELPFSRFINVPSQYSASNAGHESEAGGLGPAACALAWSSRLERHASGGCDPVSHTWKLSVRHCLSRRTSGWVEVAGQASSPSSPTATRLRASGHVWGECVGPCGRPCPESLAELRGRRDEHDPLVKLLYRIGRNVSDHGISQ